MTVGSIRLNISTPTEPVPSGRGFYQIEEESLFVQVGQFTNHRRFYSYLEATGLTLEFDRCGRLIFVEVNLPRNQWRVQQNLTAPVAAEPADIRWLDFRETIPQPVLYTNQERDILKLSFASSNRTLSHYLADSVIVQTSPSSMLTALWVTNIAVDKAGKLIGAFRQQTRANLSYYV